MPKASQGNVWLFNTNAGFFNVKGEYLFSNEWVTFMSKPNIFYGLFNHIYGKINKTNPHAGK